MAGTKTMSKAVKPVAKKTPRKAGAPKAAPKKIKERKMAQAKTTTKTTRAVKPVVKSAKPQAEARITKPKTAPVAVHKKPAPPKVVSPLKAKELEQFRAQLLEELERLKLELQEIEDRAARALEIEAAGETGDYDDHDTADTASETFEREKDLAMGDNTAAMIAKVQNALAKIDGGTYGICDMCKRPIKYARLEAIPFATLCIDCQGRVEVG
jgi:RNA polymerase-binding protein DksA